MALCQVKMLDQLGEVVLSCCWKRVAGKGVCVHWAAVGLMGLNHECRACFHDLLSAVQGRLFQA